MKLNHSPPENCDSFTSLPLVCEPQRCYSLLMVPCEWWLLEIFLNAFQIIQLYSFFEALSLSLSVPPLLLLLPVNLTGYSHVRIL